jgi:hypothetical protein
VSVRRLIWRRSAVAFLVVLAAAVLLEMFVAWACVLWSPTQLAPTAVTAQLRRVGLGPAWDSPRRPITVRAGIGVRQWGGIWMVRFVPGHPALSPSREEVLQAAGTTAGASVTLQMLHLRGVEAGFPFRSHRWNSDAILPRLTPEYMAWTQLVQDRQGVVHEPQDFSFRGRYERSAVSLGVNTDAVPKWLRPRSDATLPVMPLWPEYAANLLIYSILVATAWYSGAACRRRFRCLQGSCRGCGYDMTGLSRCPECGTMEVVPVDCAEASQ